MLSIPRLALTALAAIALAGCGGDGSGTATFDVDGFAIVFEHPIDLREIEDVPFASAAGSDSTATEARGLDERNLILVSRYDLDMSVTRAKLSAVKAELDEVVSRATGQDLSGTRIEIGGLPGYEYDFDLDSVPPVTSRLLVLFHHDAEYTLNCQWTAERRRDIEAACRQAVATLRVK
jgi:hypothetical protein